MTGAQRHQVRAVRDQIARARIDWDAEPRCAGCGVEQIDPWTEQYRYVAGCRTCSDRRLKHDHRAAVRAAQLTIEFAERG